MANREVKVYGFIIKMSANPFKLNNQVSNIMFIQDMKGFIGVCPQYPLGTACLFKTEKQAKNAMNQAKLKGIKIVKDVSVAYVDSQYIQGG